MTNIHFQPYDLNIFTKAGKRFVFDVVRKKDVPFTPEELVRQTILHYLMYTQKISPSLIAVERALTVNDIQKRFDIVVFNRQGLPLILIECKSPSVTININTFLQGGNYNTKLGATFIWLSTGKANFVFETETLQVIREMPELTTML